MTNLQAQREKIALLAQQAEHLLTEKGAQTWSAQDQTQFDNYANEIELVKGQIRATEALRELEADKFFENAAPQRANREEGEGLDAVGATALYLRHGHNVTAEQALAIRNAMSTTTPAEGGYTVPSEIAALVIDQMKAYGGMRQVAQIITTAGGKKVGIVGATTQLLPGISSPPAVSQRRRPARRPNCVTMSSNCRWTSCHSRIRNSERKF